MKSDWKRWLTRGVKLVLAIVILAFVGRQFVSDLEKVDLAKLNLRPGWLVASGVLYLIGIFPNAWFWRHLHGSFGYPLSVYAASRAHYIGQLGKYVPGKALAIAMRADLVHPFGVPYGVSIIVSFYEVLTAMAAGGIVAALICLVAPPGELVFGIHPAWIGVALIGMCGVPLLPGVFNFVIAKLTARIQAIQLYRLPPVRSGTLGVGLLSGAAGWWVQGLAWWAMLQAVLPEPPALTLSTWSQCTASIALATVVGFASMIPGGFVVRETILTVFLSPLGARADLLAAAIVLRLDWIAAEVIFALSTYWVKPAPNKPSEPDA